MRYSILGLMLLTSCFDHSNYRREDSTERLRKKEEESRSVLDSLLAELNDEKRFYEQAGREHATSKDSAWWARYDSVAHAAMQASWRLEERRIERYKAGRQDYIYPWFIILSFALCCLIHYNQSHFPSFIYSRPWLSATVAILFLYWGPVWSYWLFGAVSPTESFVPEVVRRTTRLVLASAMGYGAFLLAKRALPMRT